VMMRREDATPDIAVRSGNQRAGVGESLNVRPGAAVIIDVQASVAANGRLVVVTNGTRRTPVAVDATGAAQSTISATPGYIRFELFNSDNALVTITNPVYLQQP